MNKPIEGITHKALLGYIVAAIAFFFVVLMNTASNRPTTEEVRDIIGAEIRVIDAKLGHIDEQLDDVEQLLRAKEK